MATRRGLLLGLALLAGVTGTRAQRAYAPLEVNSASQAQLESLPGVGPALAGRVLNAREAGPFADWADLRARVKGLGVATARKLSDTGLRVNGQAFVSEPTQSR